MASEVTLTAVNHNGVEYPADTPVSEIDDISKEQLDALRETGAVGEPVVPESVSKELAIALAEVERLKAQIADNQTTSETPQGPGNSGDKGPEPKADVSKAEVKK